MKKYVMLAIAIALVCNTFVSAQEKQEPPKREQNKKEMRENKRPMPTAQQRTDRMAKELGLTEVEKAKVLVLMEKQDAKFKKHEAEMQKMREEQIAKFEIERKAQDAELEKIIGKEKFQQFEKARAEHMEKIMQHKDKMDGDSAIYMNKRQNEKRKQRPNK